MYLFIYLFIYVCCTYIHIHMYICVSAPRPAYRWTTINGSVTMIIIIIANYHHY